MITLDHRLSGLNEIHALSQDSEGKVCTQVSLGCDPGVSKLPSFWGALIGLFSALSGVGRIQFLIAAGQVPVLLVAVI